MDSRVAPQKMKIMVTEDMLSGTAIASIQRRHIYREDRYLDMCFSEKRQISLLQPIN